MPYVQQVSSSSQRPMRKTTPDGAWKCVWLIVIASLQLLNAMDGGTAAGDAAGSAAAAGIDSLTGIVRDLAETRQLVYDFWQQHGPDERFGGFHGTLDLSGTPVAPTYKGIVQEARHVWAFSTYNLHGYTRSADAAGSASSRQEAVLRRPKHRHLLQQQQQQAQLLSSQQMAKTAFDFILQHMYDSSTGMFHWHVTREGELLQDNKVIYGQWFVLYSFGQYYTAFKDPRARDLALQCFRAMDAAWHSSEFGGFNELPENEIPPAPTAATPIVRTKPTAPAATAATTGSSGGPSVSLIKVYANAARAFGRALPAPQRNAQQSRVPATSAVSSWPAAAQKQIRTLNVAMHGLEALTALHKVTRDPVVLVRIKEYLDIICTRLERSEGLIFEEYVPVAGTNGKWQPAPNSVVSYGHNLESTWLVAETLDYLLSISAISKRLAQQYRDTVMSIGAAAVRDGYDSLHGGVYETGLPITGPQSTLKVWWVQAESMLALWKLHQYYGSSSRGAAEGPVTGAGLVVAEVDADWHKPLRPGRGGQRYLRVLAKTAKFVRQHVTDETGGGEQFWQVEADGTWKPTGNVERDTKGNRWKASYHNSRSVLFLEQWMKAGQTSAQQARG